MKKILTTGLMFASILFANAQSPVQVKLWTSENGTVVDEQPVLKDWVSKVPEAGHGWGYGDNFTYKRQWTEELEKWLREICP